MDETGIPYHLGMGVPNERIGNSVYILMINAIGKLILKKKGYVMLQVKIFRFRINNKISYELDDDKQMGWYGKEYSELCSTSKMEKILNEFLMAHDVIEIKCVPVTCRINVDGIRGDDVDLIYSILYKAKDNQVAKLKDIDYLQENKLSPTIEPIPIYNNVPPYHDYLQESSGNVSPYSPDFPETSSGVVTDKSVTQITAEQNSAISDNNIKNGFTARKRTGNIYE